MESTDFEQSEKDYLQILNEKQKIKNIKETLESFKEYLSIIINSVNEGNHNEEMTDKLCNMINKYYKTLDSDVESNSDEEEEEGEDDEEEDDEEEEEEESSDTDEKSSDSNNEESKPSKLKIKEDTDSDDSESYVKFFQQSKKVEQKPKEDIYFQTFINNSVDINKRIFPINHDISKKIKIYTQKVHSY